MVKKELRKKYIEKRNAITPAEKAKWEDLMLINFQQLPIDIPSVVMSYLPMEKRNEFNPFQIEEYCRFKVHEQVLAVPVLIGDGFQAVVIEEGQQYATNAFGITEPVDGSTIEPEDIGLVIVPLLCFDESGYRVGYGKGMYDRFLAKCNPDCLKIGVSFFGPLKSIADIHTADVKLDYCITPDENYHF